jgi:hypothetical protein
MYGAAMTDEELRQAILDCLPIQGPNPENYYIDCGPDEINEAVKCLMEFVRSVETKPEKALEGSTWKAWYGLENE